MLKEIIVTAKSIEEAVADGIAQLGITEEEANIEVLEQPKKGFFRSTPAKVRVFLDATKTDIAVKILKDILKAMNIEWEVDVKVVEEETSCTLTLEGDKLGFIIGYRGETLDALQYIVGLMTNQDSDDYYRVTIDCGNYREKRAKTLEMLAERLSKKVAKSGYHQKLEPMNPYERRIIHSVVQIQAGVTSESVGEEPFRSVVIKSTNPRPKKKFNNSNTTNTSRRNDDRKKPSGNSSRYAGNKPSGNPSGNKPNDSRNRSTSGGGTRSNDNRSRPDNRNKPVNNNPQKNAIPKIDKPKTASEQALNSLGELYGKIEL